MTVDPYTAGRELDSLDLRLLSAMLAHGEFSPADLHIQRRLDRLELEGYAESVPHDATSSRTYRLSAKGRQAAGSGL